MSDTTLNTGEFTEKEVREDAALTWRAMMKAHRKADQKRGYNRFIGSIPSQNDVIRKFSAHLRFLNMVCEANHWDSVWEDPDEKQVNPGKLK